jgi:DNA-binding transcriptional LysR family regulator
LPQSQEVDCKSEVHIAIRRSVNNAPELPLMRGYFDIRPESVILSSAGNLFLEDVRRILQEITEACLRADRVARGRSGTLRVGFTENSCWRGVVPESFRRFRELQPDAELQLRPSASVEQVEAIRSGRLDAGFVNFMPKSDPELDQLSMSSWPRPKNIRSQSSRNSACAT